MALNPDVKRLLQSPIMDPAEKQNNQVLTWDASLGKWIAKNGGGSGGASSLVDLDDVGIENPTDGQIIVYDSATQKWINADAPTGGLTVIDMADYVTDGHIGYGTTTLTNPGLISALTQAKAAGNPIVIKNINLGWLLDETDPTSWQTDRIIDPCVAQVIEIGTTIEVTLRLIEQREYSFFVNDTGLAEELTVEIVGLNNVTAFTFPDTFNLTTGGNVDSQFWRSLGTLNEQVMFLKGLKITSNGSPINVLANFTITTLNPTLSRVGQFSFVYNSKIYIADWHVNNNAARDATVQINRILDFAVDGVPSNGDTLIYNAGSGTWQPGTASGGGAVVSASALAYFSAGLMFDVGMVGNGFTALLNNTYFNATDKKAVFFYGLIIQDMNGTIPDVEISRVLAVRKVSAYALEIDLGLYEISGTTYHIRLEVDTTNDVVTAKATTL